MSEIIIAEPEIKEIIVPGKTDNNKSKLVNDQPPKDEKASQKRSRNPIFKEMEMKEEVKNKLMSSSDCDDEYMDRILEGIVQNIHVEVRKRNFSYHDLCTLCGLNYAYFSKLFSHRSKIGLKALIRFSLALGMSPAEFFPYDFNDRMTMGQRFDQITRELDLKAKNYLIDLVIAYVKEYRRLSNNNTKR